MPVPSQSQPKSQLESHSQSQIKEFNRRRKLIEYTLCTDEDIWNEMKKEEIEKKEKKKKEKKSKLLAIATPEITSRLNAFLLDTLWNHWNYSQEELDLARQNMKPEMISPASIDWGQRKQDIDGTKSSQYTLNPEAQNLAFDNTKLFIPDLKSMENKPLTEVPEYLIKTYGSKYYIPGIEYWVYIHQNPDKVPQQLKDSNYYFYLGSILRHFNGRWCTPFSRWSNLVFKPNAWYLDHNWDSSDRAILIER